MTIEPHNAYKIKDKNLPFKDKGYKQSWIRFFNTKEIQNVLVDASLFLLIYEVLKSIIIGRIRNLYETGWEMDGTIWIDNE